MLSSSMSSLRKPAEKSEVKIAPVLDIGKYDGGLEADEERHRGENVHGEAAEALALSSSTAKYAFFFSLIVALS